MTDKERVIKGLEVCTDIYAVQICRDCPYQEQRRCHDLLMDDALNLLKAQPDIVRCKECKYGEQCIPPCEERYCVFYDERHDGDWFCGDGEVRQDE